MTGRFQSLETTTVPLGACRCPGTPHERDEAEVYNVLGWDDLVDIGMAASEGAGRRILVTRAIAAWNLVELDEAGTPRPVPIIEATVRLLDPPTLEAIAEAANAAYDRARAPLPNESGAGSPRSQPESDTSTPTIPETEKPTS